MSAEEEQKSEVKQSAITQRELIIKSLPDVTLQALTKIYEEAAKAMQPANKDDNFTE